ncbi:MAG: hypothetical protein J5736_03340, partial [Bacilli bacterium]|nr:hypothetical protein [Bacilli bacterium]
FPMDAIKEAGLVHVGYALLLDELDSPDPEYGTKMARLLKKIQEQGTATSLDLVSDSSLEKVQRIVRPSLPYCDYLIINEAEAASVSGIPTASSDGKTDVEGVKKALRELKALGVKRKAFIHCPEFGAVINENGEIFVVNSLHLPEGFIVGSTGAGDAFCAGVLYGLIHGWSEEKILRYASYSAANNLSSLSASDGAKNEAEIWDLGAKYSQ